MSTPLHKKSTNSQIQTRFDNDVERFSNLETGQAATIDAPLAMELITQAAIAITPAPTHILDLGCGAGNNTIKLLQTLPQNTNPEIHLLDLSLPMLEKAKQRIQPLTTSKIHTHHGDLREIPLPENTFDTILAAAVLHHLRDDNDWLQAFAKIHTILKPGGSLWITDLVTQENPKIQNLMWTRYANYLEQLGGKQYQQEVFAYIDKEDSPRPLTYQLNLLQKVGFKTTEILHKNSTFATFGAIKS